MKIKIAPIGILSLCLTLCANADLVHRYSFNDSPGSTTATDSVGGANWNATLNGTAALDGSQLVLDGSDGTFAELPGGVITNATAVTIEAWATFGTQVRDWARLFNFGNVGDSGNVLTDFRLVPRAPGNYVDLFFGTQTGGSDANHPQSLDNQTNVHVVVVLDPATGTLAAYTNGVLITSPPSAALPPLSGFTNQLSYLGKSFYAADPFLVASIDEFRVWNQPLSRAAIEASFESGPNNVSTNPGALQSIQLSVAQSELVVGLSQTANVSGQYANLTNPVTLNGLVGITYASGDTNVLTVSSAGLIQSVAVGATTVIASYQGLSATQTVTVVPNSLAPSHRYRFNDTPGSTTAVDSIGGAVWNGTLFGNAVLNGTQLVLDGSDASYLNLPAGIIGNGPALTIEAWASFGVQLRDWSRLFSFGNVDGANINEQFRLSPHSQNNYVDLNYLGAFANHPQGWDNQTNLHIVAVLNPPSGFLGLYANGVLIGRTSNATTPLSPAPDQLSYVGRSLYPADPYLIATINEFRIYDGALTPDRIAIDTAAGPDNLVTNAGPLQAAALQLSPQMKLGETQHAFFAGSFANVSNVDLFLYGSATATSSDTNVATIDATGLVRAIATGTATIAAQFGTFHSSAQVTVAPAVVTHRYSFNDPASSTTVADAIAGASGIGTLNGSARLDGTNLVLDGVDGYVRLPAGIISGYSAVSFEAWASFSANAQWVRLWDFGDQNSGGFGNSSIYFTPHNGSDGLNLTMFKPGFGSDVGLATNLDNVPEMQIVGVYTDKEMDLYFNGALVGRNTNVQLAVTDNIDVNSFIGKSMFNPDPYLNGAVDEFRIYQGALTSAQVASDYAAGPDALPTPAPSLAIKLGAGIVTISWPTNAGRYILVATTNLASPFSFSNFNPIEQNGQIVVTDSVTNQAKFYQLRLGP